LLESLCEEKLTLADGTAANYVVGYILGTYNRYESTVAEIILNHPYAKGKLHMYDKPTELKRTKMDPWCFEIFKTAKLFKPIDYDFK